ncbi:MAG: hypothetical protein AB7O66_10215 [Limisphaerales bacterium]
MKTNRRTSPNLVVVAALSLSATMMLANAQSFDVEHSTRNAALAASPRTLEAYPWLAFQGAEARSSSQSTRATTAVAKVQAHSGLASAPRMIEEFPQLALGGSKPSSRPTTKPGIPPKMLGNEALASSPRVIEDFPALGRPGTVVTPVESPAFEVAPLK